MTDSPIVLEIDVDKDSLLVKFSCCDSYIDKALLMVSYWKRISVTLSWLILDAKITAVYSLPCIAIANFSIP